MALEFSPISQTMYDTAEKGVGKAASGGFMGKASSLFSGVPQGFMVASLITLGGSILGSMFRPKPPVSAEERWFNHIVNTYSGMGRKAKTARGVAKMFGASDEAIGKISIPDARTWYQEQSSKQTDFTLYDEG